MNFYHELGPLVLGTRLKRLSDHFLSEVNKVYLDNNIPFEASWFGVFYLLDKHTELSIYEIAETLNISHSAVSQMIKTLQQKELVIMNTSSLDGRKKVISFSTQGIELLNKIKPIWKALDKTLNTLLNNNPLINDLLKLENELNNSPLSTLINQQIHV
jgi:DNA-binding MarR family transcriptional regulator